MALQAQINNGRPANTVLGQPSFVSGDSATTATGMSVPTGVAVDPVSGKLFVADVGNHRVLRFSAAATITNGGAAEAVLGQADFVSGNSGLSDTRMKGPSYLEVDSTGRLWVSDTDNHRVLWFDDAASKPSGAAADGVLGQSDFVSDGYAISSSGMRFPRGLEVDVDGNLWVADSGNHRVLRFLSAATLLKGADASAVFGQPDFVSATKAAGANGMNFPWDVATRRVPPYFTTKIALWVADGANNRVLRFDDVLGKPDGANADSVLGQSNFTNVSEAAFFTGFNAPSGVEVDGSALWVSDQNNNRVLRFESAFTLGNGAAATNVLGQKNFLGTDLELSQAGLVRPYQIAADKKGNIYVAQWRASPSNRVTRYSAGVPQPDNLIGKSANQIEGNDLYNVSAAGQRISQRFAKKRGSKFFFQVGNDGPNADGVFISGTSGGKYRVRYFLLSGGKINVTGTMLSPGGDGRYLPYAADLLFRGEVKPRSRFRNRRIRRTFSITTRSDANDSLDRVKARMVYKPK